MLLLQWIWAARKQALKTATDSPLYQKDHSSIVRRDPQRPCEIFRFCWKQQEARIFSKIFLLSSKKYEEGKINHWNLCAKMSLSDS
jgi:hypothetical protein